MIARSADVAATVYQALGIEHDSELRDRLDRPMPVLAEGRPIRGLL